VKHLEAEQLLVPGEDGPALKLGRTAVDVGGQRMVFVNFNGGIDPAWTPKMSVRRMGRAKAMLFDCADAFVVCSGGVANDGTPYRGFSGVSSFHINYAAAVPFVERHAHSQSPYLNFRDARRFPGSGGFLTWDGTRRRCAVTDPRLASSFCLVYKGMDYDAGQQDCRATGVQKFFEMVGSKLLTRMVQRLRG